MRTQIAVLIISCCIVSCQEKEPIKEVKISNFNGIVSTEKDENFFVAGDDEMDSTDWYMPEQWNSEIFNLFFNSFPDSIPPQAGNDVLMLPFPNPTTDTVILRIHNIIVPYHLSYRLVDKYYNVHRSGDNIFVPVTGYNTVDVLIDLTDIPVHDTLRLYYGFSYNQNNWTQFFHGDIVKN